jgi:hypothetical protein
MMKKIYLLLTVFIFVACDNNKNVPVVTPVTPVFDVKDADSLIGQKLDVVQPALEAAKIAFRVVEKDGEPYAVTADYSPDRLNFKIKNGLIIGVSKG